MKKIISLSGIILSLLVVLQSCKKDDDSPVDYSKKIAGSWKFVSGGTSEKYLVINNDRTCSVLSADAQGIRDKNNGVVLVTDGQISIDRTIDQSTSEVDIFNYKISGDSLKLSKPNEKIALVRDASAPAASDWVKALTAAVTYKAPVNEATDITYDGALLWYGNGYASHYLYKINLANGSIDSIPTTVYAWSVEAYDNDLWTSSDGSETIFKVDKTTGNTTYTSTNMGAWIYGIARDNNYLWCVSNNEQTLYEYNTSNNTVPVKTKLLTRWEGLAYRGSQLIAAANGKLHICTTAPVQGTASYELPGYYIFGVAYDGGSFWVSAYKYNDYNNPKIIKLGGLQ